MADLPRASRADHRLRQHLLTSLPCRRAGRHRLRPRPQAARQDRQDRLPAPADAAGRGPAPGMLDPARSHPGMPGAARDLSRPAGRAHRLGAADPRGLVPARAPRPWARARCAPGRGWPRCGRSRPQPGGERQVAPPVHLRVLAHPDVMQHEVRPHGAEHADRCRDEEDQVPVHRGEDAVIRQSAQTSVQIKQLMVTMAAKVRRKLDNGVRRLREADRSLKRPASKYSSRKAGQVRLPPAGWPPGCSDSIPQ